MPKVLFFSTNSLIWEHAFPEALVAESLIKSGAEIIYVTCGGCLSTYCTSISARDVSYNAPVKEKRKICKSCCKRKDILRTQFAFHNYDLDRFITKDDQLKIQEILQNITRENFLEFKMGDIAIGKIALYEIFLRYKKNTLQLAAHEWEHYLLYLRSSLITYFAANKILQQEKPDSVIVYNSLYATNAVVCKLARSLGISQYFLHAGTNLSNQHGSLMLGQDFTWRFLRTAVKEWEYYKNKVCSEKELSYVTAHFIELLKGNNIFVYSPKKSRGQMDIRAHFNIMPQQKILVATMSSYDERFAVETVGAFPNDYHLLFPKQVDWIKELIAWVQQQAELFLIIRVHPREFPNRRENVTSEHAKLLKKVFLNLPANVKIDWPEDKISIYDLALETDVFLNAWSSVGKEMSLLGLPVVVYSPDLLLYPADLNYVGTTKQSYFAKITQALEEGWNFEKIRCTYRWFALEFCKSQISIQESYQAKTYTKQRHLHVRILAKIKRMFFAEANLIQDCKKRQSHLQSANTIREVIFNKYLTPLQCQTMASAELSQTEETAVLKKQIKKIVDMLAGDMPSLFIKTKLGRKLSNL